MPAAGSPSSTWIRPASGSSCTRVLERIIVDEERHIDWIEAQQHKISEVGYQQYLAQQIYA